MLRLLMFLIVVGGVLFVFQVLFSEPVAQEQPYTGPARGPGGVPASMPKNGPTGTLA